MAYPGSRSLTNIQYELSTVVRAFESLEKDDFTRDEWNYLRYLERDAKKLVSDIESLSRVALERESSGRRDS